MSLISPRFAGNDRLQQASENGPPMKKWERRNDAVKILQQALIDLGFPMPRSAPPPDHIPDGVYGDETVSTVRAFQTRHTLVKKDGIAGKETLLKMDTLFQTPSALPPPLPPGSVVPGSPIPHLIGSRGGCGRATRRPANEFDFSFNDYPPERIDREMSVLEKAQLVRFRGKSVQDLSRDVIGELTGVPILASSQLVGQMVGRFVAGQGTDFVHDIGTALSVLARGSAALRAATTTVKASIKRQVTGQAAGVIDYRTLRVTPPEITFDLVRDGGTLTGLLGGTQGCQIFIGSFNASTANRTYTATLRFVICDNFGVGRNDILASPGGLAALWVLQHEQRPRPPFPRPFVNQINVNQEISDTY